MNGASPGYLEGKEDDPIKKSRYTEEQIIAAIRSQEADETTADVCRRLGVHAHTFHRWKAKHGGMNVSEAKRLRELEDENGQLKHIVADLTLDNRALKDVLAKTMVKPAARRSVVRYLMTEWHLSERRSCRLVGVWRATYRYQSRRRSQEDLRERFRELAKKHPRYGYWRLYRKLRRTGWTVNHKRVRRLYREEGLFVAKRSRKRVTRQPVPAVVPTRPNQRWSTDFVSDATADGRRLRILNVVDDFTREALAMEVDTSLPAARVVRVLDRVAAERGEYPKTIWALFRIGGQDGEFVSWGACQRRVRLGPSVPVSYFGEDCS